MLFKLPVLPFILLIMLAILFPVFIAFIILPIGALVFIGRAKVFVPTGIIGCCERVDMPVPGGGFRLNPEVATPLVVVVVGGGGREKEEDEVRF